MHLLCFIMWWLHIHLSSSLHSLLYHSNTCATIHCQPPIPCHQQIAKHEHSPCPASPPALITIVPKSTLNNHGGTVQHHLTPGLNFGPTLKMIKSSLPANMGGTFGFSSSCGPQLTSHSSSQCLQSHALLLAIDGDRIICHEDLWLQKQREYKLLFKKQVQM